MALALTYEAADNPINGTSYLIKKTVVSQDLVCPGIANNAYVEVYGQTEIGIPGVGGTSTGAFTFEVEVVGQTANTGDFSATIFRMNSSGTAVGQSADVFLTGNQWGNGVKTFTWSSPSLGTWAAGDRFVVRVQCRWLGGTGTTGSITLRLKADGKTRIIVPWDPNVLEAPEDLTEWTKTNATVTADAIAAPNGATTADRVRETATAGCIIGNPTPHSLTSGDVWTPSYFVKPEGRNGFYLSLANTGMAGVKFLCTGNGSILSSDAGYSGTVQALSGAYAGWYRLQITRTIPSTTTYTVQVETLLDTGAVPGTGDSTKGYSGFGAVLEKASSASAYPGITISSPDYTIAITALTTSSPDLPTLTVTQVAVGATRTVILTSGSTWTVPSDFGLPATVECIGGGGGAAEIVPQFSENRGGGGGGYAKKALGALTLGSTVSFAIGGAGVGYWYNAGSPRSATNGGDTWFSATSFCLGRGGRSGLDQAYNAVNGGGAVSGSANVGDTIASGGSGGFGSQGGVAATGGGGAGGPNGAGGSGGTCSTTSGSLGGTGGGGANGGGSSTTTSTTAGTAGGTNRVGSGAGAAGVAGTSNGGAGSNGGGGGGGAVGSSSWAGGVGSQDTLWTDSGNSTTAGPGSGGGAGGCGAASAGGAGGNGGGYGGGGGGAAGYQNSGSTAPGGGGTQGVIIITYTPGILPLTIGSPTLPTLTVVQFVAHPVIFLTAGSSWTVPADFNLPATVECIGGGGGGNRTSSTQNQNRGGGGGGYGKKALTALTPGASVSYAIGAAGLGFNSGAVSGSAQSATNGGDTWFSATTFCNGRGGRQGADQAIGANNGGGQVSGAANVGDTIASGGSGGINNNTAGSQGTAGGGAGGPNGAGAAGGGATVSTSGGGGGGGANGGAAGSPGQSGGNNGGAGGNNRSAAGGGAGGVSGGAAAVAGTNGGGGGGGAASGLDGAAGSQENIWQSTADNSFAGPGSGGGAGGTFGNGGVGGVGGGYGGGGGAAGIAGSGATNNINGNGKQGIIVISYTAMSSVALTSLSTGSPTLPTVLIVPQSTIAITTLSISSPSMPLAAATQVHAIVITTMSIGSPSMPTVTATQRQVITFTALSIGSPGFPTVAITQLQIMAVSNLSIGPPTGLTGYPAVVNFTVVISLLSLSPIIPPTFVATQAHAAAFTANSISSPALPTLAITQGHVVAATPLSISSPALPTLAATQVQTIAFVPFSIGSPVFPTALATQAHLIALTAKSISSPTFGTVTATQTHNTTFTALSPASPSLGQFTIFQPSVVAITSTSISSPVFPTYAPSQFQTIVFSGIDVSSPSLTTYAVVQIQVVIFSGVTIGALGLPTFGITQAHGLTLTSKTIASPVLPTFVPTQVHVVHLNNLNVSSPEFTRFATSEFITLEPTSSTANNWTTNTGGSNLYAVVDETSPDDSDYIHSPSNPVGEIAVLTFTLPTDRVMVAPITVRYRIGKELNNTRRIDQTVRVYDDADLLAEWVHTDVPYALTTIEQMIETSSPSSLRIEIQADAP